MKKVCKKLLIIFTVLVMAVSTLLVSACTYSAKPLQGDYKKGDVTSQGGWVVQKGDYTYFINGNPVAPTDEEGNTLAFENKYGEAVKGSLMRIKTSDMGKANVKADIVVPLLLTAADYNAGVFIYDNYVYYATPTTATDLHGEKDSNYLDFKRTRLDGTETMKDYYFRVSSTATEYRFVEINEVVYCIYMEGSDIRSYNTDSRKDNLLVKDTSSHVFHKNDKGDTNVYYTMNVTMDIDKKNPSTADYNQVYRVSADATATVDAKEASYTVTGGKEYDFDKQSLEQLAKDAEDGDEKADFKAGKIETYPYVNLGELVLDGWGSNFNKTALQYNEQKEGVTPATPDGYKYTLISYENGGLYYKRQSVSTIGSNTEQGNTYYLDLSKVDADGWDAVSGNKEENNFFLGVAGGNVNTGSLFYMVGNDHYYVYISNGSIVSAKVLEDGTAQEVTIAKNVASTKLLSVDNSNEDFKYVYYQTSANDTVGLGRAVLFSKEIATALSQIDTQGMTPEQIREKEVAVQQNFYNAIIIKDEYKAVNVLSIMHPANWYDIEIIDGTVFFVDATNVGTVAINNASITTVKKADGTDMTNADLKKRNDLLRDFTEALDNANEFSAKAGNALFYYTYTGDKTLYEGVIAEAKEDGKGEYSIFSKKEQDYFNAYVNKTKDYKVSDKETVDFSTLLVNDEGEYFGMRSYFYQAIGFSSEEEMEDLDEAWRTTYLSAPAEEEEETGLEAWQWVLIGIAIGVGVSIIVVVIVLLVRKFLKKKNADDKPKRKKYAVDMTDDESIDVYADDKAETEEKTEVAEESTATADTAESSETPVAEAVTAEETTTEDTAE